MYRALYRKWRPRDFDDVCGQPQVTDILKYEVANGKTSHAYLFCGSRGTGKTSCAKILAKAVNCENPKNGNPCNACPACLSIDKGLATDVVEMDAASNTGVDNVRDIKDEIVFTPAELRHRVYIIDEVHMMSGSAFNALLKTLEEPPEHVVFILATTELQKLPSTIVSRCQRFDFRRLTFDTIVARLLKIAQEEKIALTPEGARLIARMALGGMRDAISLLELCAGTNKEVNADLVSEILGSGNRGAVEHLIDAVIQKDYAALYRCVAEEVMSSRDLSVLLRDVLDYYRDMLLVKTAKSTPEYLDLTDVEAQAVERQANSFTVGLLLYHSRLLEDALSDMQRNEISRRTVAEMTLTRMCEPRLSDTTESLLARLDKLEAEVSRLKYNGCVAQPSSTEGSPSSDSVQANETARNSAPKTRAETQEDALGKPTYRLIGTWSEIVDQVSKTKPSMHGFLDTAKAYRSSDGNSYLIRASSTFCAKMLQRPEVESALKLAISEEEGRDISACSFLIEGTDVSNRYHFADEIANAIE